MQASVVAVGGRLIMILAAGAFPWPPARNRSTDDSGEAAAFGSQLTALREDQSDAAKNESAGRD